MTDLLLVQPISGELPYIVPAGAIALCNLVNVPKLGVFEWELSDALIREAKVVALPIQWAYSLPSAIRLAHRLKAVNPNVKIVAGGYIVDLYSSKLFEVAPFDYLIAGDAEKTFPKLISAIISDESVPSLPNLLSRELNSTNRYTISNDDFDSLNSLIVDWFPSLMKIAQKSQKLDVPTYIYPWVEFTRGCIYDCNDCLGSTTNQRILAGRTKPAIRSSESAKNLLCEIERKKLKWVYFTSDFITIAGETWAGRVLERRYNLTAYYECYKLPELEKVEMLKSAFGQIILGVTVDICKINRESSNSADWSAFKTIADVLGDAGKLLVYFTDKSSNVTPKELIKKFWFKFYRSSEFESLVPKSLPKLEVLMKKLEKDALRLTLFNKILRLVLDRATFLFKFFWRYSSLRALKKVKKRT